MKQNWVATIAWVATYALLLVGANTSPAWGQDLPNMKKVGQEDECCLGPEHYHDLNDKIEALKAEIKKVQEALGKAPDGSTEESNLLSELQALKAELKKLNEKLDEGGSLSYSYSNAGWNWGVGLTVQGVLLSGSDTFAIPFKVDGMIRWISKYRLGIELGIHLGVWFTEDDSGDLAAPFNVGGHAYFLAWWKHFGVFAGPELSYLMNPYKNEPGFVQVNVLGGIGLRAEWFHWRLGTGAAAYNQISRTYGWWLTTTFAVNFDL